VSTDPLAALDFTATVECQTFNRRKLWLLPVWVTRPCPSAATLLVRVHHMPSADGGTGQPLCYGAQTAVCLEHGHDFYHDTLEPLVDFFDVTGFCPGCGASLEDESEVYTVERL